MSEPMTAVLREREHSLIAAAQDDPGAFAAIYEQQVDHIYSYALHCLHDRMAAEDVVSETFGRAFENLARYEWRGVPVSAWLFRIASNAIVSHYRRMSTLPLDAAVYLQDGGPGPEEALLRSERQREVRAAVAALPLSQQQAVSLRYGQDLSYREIALILGRTEGTVKQLLHRARRGMQRRLAAGPEGGEGVARRDSILKARRSIAKVSTL